MSEESSQTCLWLKITETQRNYASPISCCCDCPSFGLLSFGGQIVHINEGKGTLAHFTLQTMFYLSLSSHFYFPPPPQFYYFPSSIFSFPPPQFQNFNIFLPPPPHFYCFPSSSCSFLLFSHRRNEEEEEGKTIEMWRWWWWWWRENNRNVAVVVVGKQ